MNVDLLWSTFVLLSSPLLTLCDPLFVLSAPNLLRVGSLENIFVEAQDYSGEDLNVKVTVKNFPRKNVEIASKSVTLREENNFQQLVDIQISDNRNLFSHDPLEKQYVHLQAQFPSRLLEKVVMVSFQSGYIFVQTDKAMYTPASTVQYRILSVTPGLQPLEHSGISVDIMNPQGITTMGEVVFPDKGIKSGKYAIPALASPGIWKVVTKFKNTPQKNFTADFEVKEYVLPTFEVTLSLSQSYFSVNDESLIVDILAKYLFGNNVNGNALVVFGVMDDERKTSIPSSLQRISILDGEGQAKLTNTMILQTFPDINPLVGQSIYISVSVFTDSGTEMVEAHRRGIQIVTSPYTIRFKGTPQYFKPGMPFDVSVYITDPEQMPVKNVDVEVNTGEVRGRTKGNGIAKFTVNSQEGTSTLEITARTNDPQLTDEEQAVMKITAQAYVTKDASNNYLHVGINAAELQIGDQIKVNLNTGRSTGAKDQDYTYLIISKGQIIKVDRFKRKGQSLVTLSLPVTKDMVPSFRFVAYYHVGSDEVVSDSVWVDVKDTCMGTLTVQVNDPQPIYEPGGVFSLKITGDPGAKVGLVVVDKAVHVLNKNRFTQSKIWDVIEKHDTGCTAGSGRDSMGVFYDAGLMFESSTAGGTNTRTMQGCPTPSKRRRRSNDLQLVTTRLAGKYSGGLKKCCVDGMRDNKLGYTCEQRAMYIEDGQECVQAFLNCCNDMLSQSDAAGEQEMILARSEDDDYYESFDEITSRTQFPDSWLWGEEVLPLCPADNKLCQTTSLVKSKLYLKESITTWQIFAVSLSKTHGICVADPYEMIVYKNFFIELKIPFSAVRNEQLQIRAIIHNYTRKKQKVRVEFTETEHICSSASEKGSYMTDVEVDAMSSRSVPYVIIPLDLGNHWIEAKAVAYDSAQTDGVRKILKVVSEGLLTIVQEKNVELNPAKIGVMHVSVRSHKPIAQVPNTPANTYISITSKNLSALVEQAIGGGVMSQFIVQPRGNGEEIMILMTLPLIAAHYLDSTNQWDAVGVDRRNEAINHINTGYQRALRFRKVDGSYADLMSTPSSTWLTAYVAKVFVMANDLIIVDKKVLCSALKWLVKQQQPDGTFKEDAHVVHEEMIGDVRDKDADASLTAFVLIAMQEGSEICARSFPNLKDSMNGAIQYLTLRVHSLTNPYAVAMTSYALAHADKLNKDILMSYSRQNDAGTFWQVPGLHRHSLEATGYAVLALVKAKEFVTAGQAVRWLARQIDRYGGPGTTQATIIVFQAVAEYRTQAKKQDFNLDVEVSVEGRNINKLWTFTRSNNYVTRSEKVKLMQNFNITARGTGAASLSVYTLYYALPEEKNTDCEMFDLSVLMTKERQASSPGAIETYLLTIETNLKNPDRDAALTVLDIGLLTGYKVDDNDLSQLSKGKDKYIDRYEKKVDLSERGSLMIFLNKMSHEVRERVAFRIHKMNEVGMLQPAGVTLYEYNSPDDRCVKFYHPHKKDGALNQLCHEDLCHCAEENCSFQKKHRIKESHRADKACSSDVDYVYKTRLENVDLSLHADIYNMTIEQVLKEGTDPAVEGHLRSFLAHPHCRDFLKLEAGKSYLIMGQTKPLPRIGGSLRYSLGEKTWIEYWPTRNESQTAEYKEPYIGIGMLAEQLFNIGCTT
ncbi:complement C3-like isoform X2 [Triplophysa dalaica]|uniref:complement C3-like isoform X2 n=1 Tax=Triplophysa dalaica TaxID=1582913 RepID=UPI0024DF66B4|nr:complement C3-like isoform X2 [Triplophysa dalaica]